MNEVVFDVERIGNYTVSVTGKKHPGNKTSSIMVKVINAKMVQELDSITAQYKIETPKINFFRKFRIQE